MNLRLGPGIHMPHPACHEITMRKLTHKLDVIDETSYSHSVYDFITSIPGAGENVCFMQVAATLTIGNEVKKAINVL